MRQIRSLEHEIRIPKVLRTADSHLPLQKATSFCHVATLNTVPGGPGQWESLAGSVKGFDFADMEKANQFRLCKPMNAIANHESK